ncbi:MAG: lipoyl(octanoyl) transferase LipB [Cryomorphaceae bacterium]|nr:MAG: lipoyl(octanoyl) transferase LipB [Cryomorphaceae bacterium]
MKPAVAFQNLGLMDYRQAWDYQEQLFKGVVDQKIFNRNHPEEAKTPPNYLLFCQHPHVYTLGKSGDVQNLLLDEEGLERYKASFYPINRGGDITYHGPGQIVGYPILDLDQFYTDIHRYLRELEEAVIRTLAEYGISGDRYPGYTGVWLDPDDPNRARKICALGVKCSRWVTMHGFAFNVNTDLSYFGHIIPCGIDDKAVTSMEVELGSRQNFDEVSKVLRGHLSAIFGWNYV